MQAFLDGARDQNFTYAQVGATRPTAVGVASVAAVPGTVLLHNRVALGQGRGTYERACRALRTWQMFSMGWVRLHHHEVPIAIGSVVAVEVRLFGLYWLNAARIVYTISQTGSRASFGFAYGTLEDHAESGEERFLVEYDTRTREVWYDLLSFSRPNKPLVRMGAPLARSLQRRFAAASLQAMVRACS